MLSLLSIFLKFFLFDAIILYKDFKVSYPAKILEK